MKHDEPFHLAVRDGVEHLGDFRWCIDFLLFAGQRVRGHQAVHCKRMVNIIQYDLVFLWKDKR